MTGNFIQRFRHRIHLHTQTSRSFIHQVNRLIRQETVSNISTGQFNSRNDCIILDTHFMMILILLLQSSQDRYSIDFRRLIHHYYLESAFQCFIFFKVLLILFQSSRTDRPQISTSQCGLQDIGSIHGSFTFACAHQCMDFINEEYDLTFRLHHFVDHSLQSLFKFTFIFSTRYQGSHIQREYLFSLQILRDVTSDNSLRKSFCNRSLTDTRLTYQNRVVFSTTAQNLQNSTNLFITTDDRIQLSTSCTLIQIDGIFAQRFVSILGRLTGYFVSFTQLINCLTQLVFRKTCILQNLRSTALFGIKSQNNRFDGNILITHLR